ncbi:MAG: M16 family metallopeptidase, partial [Planctomycetota bacterium]
SANDPAGKTGAVSLLGRMLRTGGTKNLTPADVDAEIERMAATITFGFDGGSGTAHLRILKRHLGRGLGLLFDMLRNPRFADARLQLAKDNILEGMKGRNDDVREIQRREVRWLLYGTEYPRAKLATKAEVESITADDLRALHTALIHPSRMQVLVAGDWTADEAIADLGARLSDWGPAPAEPAGVPAPDSKTAPGLYFFQKGDTTQSSVLIAKLGTTFDHPDRFAIQMMNYVLGGGSFSSRLTQAIRVDRGLAYSAFSQFSPGTWHEGAFVAGFQSKHATCAEGLRVALDEIERLKKDGPTDEELAAARNAAIEQFPQAFSSPEAVAGALAGLEFHGRDPKFFETMRDKIRAVTKEDCIRVANEWLKPDTFYIMMVGDIEAIKAGRREAQDHRPHRLRLRGTGRDVQGDRRPLARSLHPQAPVAAAPAQPNRGSDPKGSVYATAHGVDGDAAGARRRLRGDAWTGLHAGLGGRGVARLRGAGGGGGAAGRTGVRRRRPGHGAGLLG